MVDQFSRSVISKSLGPHGLQRARLTYPLPIPGAYTNSCPLSQWYHSTMSSSVAPFSSCPQSFQASGSFHISWLFTTGGQSIGALALASVLPMNIQGWFPLDWLVWSPYCPRDSQESFPAPQFKSISSSALSLLYGPTLTSIHDYWKNLSLDSCVPYTYFVNSSNYWRYFVGFQVFSWNQRTRGFSSFFSWFELL